MKYIVLFRSSVLYNRGAGIGVMLESSRLTLCLADCKVSVRQHTGCRAYDQSMQQRHTSAALAAGRLTVCDLFDRVAARLAHKTAVIDGTRRATYGELAATVAQRGALLAARGVQHGDLVGIALGRSLEMVAWVLAILETGAAYVPLDPSYPRDRLRFVVEDAGLRLALVEQDSAWAHGLPLELLCAEEEAATAARLPARSQSFANRAQAGDAAYVLYTSGSTGVPKGVVVTHAALAHFIGVVPQALGIREDDIWLLTASISYAVQVRQMMTPLAVGATIAVAGDEALRDPVALMQVVKESGVTLVDFVPSYWRTCNRVLTELPEDTRRALLDNKLRQIVSVGEPLTYDLPCTWRHTLGHPAQVVNILGQTETTGMFAAYTLPAGELPFEGVVPVGRPLAGVELQLLDAQGKAAAEGEAGEVYLSTPCLARGYLHRPQLTAQRFLPHPQRGTSATLYRTGDLARWGADGNLHYLCRVDQQVKVRGKRVDLVEVEACLRHAEGVQDAAVAALLNADGETEIRGYVTANPHAQLGLRPLWAELRRKLPEHALPRMIYAVEALPYLPNGKLDRQRLALLCDNAGALGLDPPCAGDESNCGCRTAQQKGTDAPGGEDISDLLQACWCEVLGSETACCEDDFFAVGGTSLQAALLAARLGRMLGRRVPVDLIYRQRTFGALGAALGDLRSEQAEGAPARGGPLVLLRGGAEDAPFFLVHGLGGGVFGYADLVDHLPEGCAIYGLQAAGLEGEEPPDQSIEAMAERFVAAVRTLQPHGPYRLGGYCFGGVVAFEMARQLSAAGEPSALVAIIEGFAPGWRRGHAALLYPERLRLLASSLPFWWQEYRALGAAALRRRIGRKLRPRRQVPAAMAADGAACAPGEGCQGLAQDLVDDDLSVLPSHRRRLLDVHMAAIRHYTPGPYAGEVTVFRARRRTISHVVKGPLDKDLGWSALAARVTEHEVEGAHRNVHLLPYVLSLAAALSVYLP
jgi:aspartate racemase